MNPITTIFRLFKRTLALVFILILAACANTSHKAEQPPNNQPDWVLNTPIKSGFLYGVGAAEIFAGDEGSASNRAKDMARLELIKQVEVNVSGEVEQSIEEVTRNNTTELTQQLRQQVRNQVPAFSLSGVQSVDSYRDAHGKHITVLIRFDVSKELSSLRSQIASLDDQLENYQRTLAESVAQGMSLLRLIAPALVLTEQRAGLQARYNKLDPNGPIAPLLNATNRALLQHIYQKIAALKVSVTAQGRSEPSLHTGLIAGLNQKGIQVTEYGSSDIRVRYRLQINNIPRQGVYFSITEGQLWIEDEAGHVVRAVQAKAKGVSTDPKEARSRSIDKLSNQLSAALLAALF